MKVREVVETSSHHINGNPEKDQRGSRLSAQTDMRSRLTGSCMGGLTDNCTHSLQRSFRCKALKIFDLIAHMVVVVALSICRHF
jgi:hypothetical protein